MVTQVVIAIADSNVEYNASEKFLQISFNVAAVAANPFCQFEITDTCCAIVVAEHCHGRCEMPAPVK